ncbi:MFS transporter [Salinibacterium sp. G-O1]|uniref:MFS transporter n=1 Tax=Salinibacterium sp. G-O1 TaxID=3046208 RepID=UPI0024BB546E|nr:MFS transporter [Salinibacterium sp. G-O1]MDJ0334224.1 MFS transporter [Salinibacterium sp. G-O1]
MRFSALRVRWYRGYLMGGSLLMAGDNAEHALTYWVMWQLYHSPVLAGFAVVSHWLPHLFFSIPFGSLADRFDNRRIIQTSLALFMLVSVGWGVLIVSATLQPWHCVVLLVLHGFASALWQPADKVMLLDMVGTKDLTSGIRLMATGLSLGQLVGPAIGAVLLFTIGPGIGMFVIVALYIPFLVYLIRVPIDGHSRRAGAARPARPSVRQVFGVLKEVPRFPPILAMMLLQGSVGLLIGTAVMPLLPEFGELLGQSDSGLGYGLLLVATSLGAIVGGIGLEAIGGVRASSRLAIMGTIVFAASMLVFALSRSVPLTLLALGISGLASIISMSTAQTVIQLAAPADRQGLFVGAGQTTAMGSRVGSGVVIGALGVAFGIPSAVAVSATALLVVSIALLVVVMLWVRRDRIRPGIVHADPMEALD